MADLFCLAVAGLLTFRRTRKYPYQEGKSKIYYGLGLVLVFIFWFIIVEVIWSIIGSLIFHGVIASYLGSIIHAFLH